MDDVTARTKSVCNHLAADDRRPSPRADADVVRPAPARTARPAGAACDSEYLALLRDHGAALARLDNAVKA